MQRRTSREWLFRDELEQFLEIRQSRPWGFHVFEVHDNRQMNVGRLLVLRTGRIAPRKYSWYSFLLEAESTPEL